MAEFKISRFRYTWKGNWTTSTSYIIDDIVRYGGSSWVCVRGHSASTFAADLAYILPGTSTASPAWIKMTDGYSWRGDWNTATLYNPGDTVRKGGIVYLCTTSHTSGTFNSQQENWTVYSENYNWIGDWATNTIYYVGDIVRYNGIVYRCIAGHTSASTLEVGDNDGNLDSTLEKWEVVISTTEYQGDWRATQGETDPSPKKYRVNDLVTYGATLWRCVETHTVGEDSTLTFDQNQHWTVEMPGQQLGGEWSSTTTYQLGDLVTYGGYVYYASANNYNDPPGTNIYELETREDPVSWQIVSKGRHLRGDWVRTETYKTGDVVRRGGYIYVALLDTTADGSSLDYLDATNWQALVPGQHWNDTWKYEIEVTAPNLIEGEEYTIKSLGTSSFTGVGAPLNEVGIVFTADGPTGGTGVTTTTVVYSVGDIVVFEGTAYKCTVEHVADTQNYPGDNGSGYSYWDVLLEGDADAGLRFKGDILTYDLSRDLAGDTSTFSPTGATLGEIDELAVVSSGSVDYKTWGTTEYSVYVAPSGVDDETDADRGFNYFKPWKTIRFACERIDALGINLVTPVKIYLYAGTYEEILPIIVPEGVNIIGEEVRGVTIKPNAPIEALGSDSTYTQAVLARMAALMSDLMLGNAIDTSAGNDEYQIFPAAVDDFSDTATAELIQDLISNISDYIDFHLNNEGTEPEITGTNKMSSADIVIGNTYQILEVGTTNFQAFGAISNTVGLVFTAIANGSGNGVVIETNAKIVAGIKILENNKEFLAAEAVAFMEQSFPSYNFDPEKCKRDVRRYIDAWKYDILYTGNYKSLIAARYYRNAVLGSSTEDMFYVRNATGVRNATLVGLTGVLNPPGVYQYYQRPTGGAYVSLDPGWGPDDERTWISSRSPYIQNCCTFGYASVGAKIDGSIHNGGYKSMVANDYTQIISDGIGAWVTNGGRVELISVFTYYSQVGYLAEDGGIIRAANGNCSYGTYGAMSIGIDASEVPHTGKVSTRNNQAQVVSAFAGEVNDEILILEFSHAGQNYTQADYTFTGAGINASVVQDDFRDNAVIQSRITQTLDSTNYGGTNYTVVENNCQGGNTTQIQLASSDANEEADYLGMRIVIVSGPGTGQYASVASYVPGTKVLTVVKESTGEPGWDHVIPGYPIVTTLLPATRYRIEPKATFSDPGFSATRIDIPVGASWADIIYGETTEEFNNLSNEAGTGTVETQDGLEAITASFNITKTGRSYSVAINNAGAGYAVDDVIHILGTSLGGNTPENDCTITVTGVSNDSTNSIVSITYEGIGISGKFIASPSNGQAMLYSKDGDTWTDTSLPSSGNWKAMATGQNRFVAIRYNSAVAASSLDGVNWTTRALPASRNWNSVTYGGGKFVAVAGNLNSAAYSTDGITWSSATMPTFGDSTYNEWVSVAYGRSRFVAVANTGNIAAYSDNGTSWTGVIMDVVADSSQKDWIGIAYGNNRFVAISSQGDVAYSFTGEVWYGASMPTQDGSTAHNWTQIKYAQGIFFAVGTTGSRDIGADPTTGPTSYAATSEDGILWTPRTLTEELNWSAIGFGNPDVTLEDSTLGNNKPMWIAVSSDTTPYFNKIITGARAKGRVTVSAGQIESVRLWDPGSGYLENPTLTVYDPHTTIDVYTENRLGDGVLAQPSWINRGLGYRTSTTDVTVTGDGFADIIPIGKHLTLTDLSIVPKVGSQVTISGSSTIYTIVRIEEIDQVENTDGLSAYCQVKPIFEISDDFQNGTPVTIRERYSQCRITGHDFLDIGTGNFEETNYPTIYATGVYDTSPFNEVVEEEGGRVFYTSTDQSGNFRTGELFAVEQATGIVTISADFFDLTGLSELKLGGVRIGGSGVTIRDFSTDIYFTEDSNNVVPTQRAIKAYLNNRLSVSGSDLVSVAFTAGQIKVGPSSISNVLGLPIYVNTGVSFQGSKAAISGSILAQTMFYRSFKDD